MKAWAEDIGGITYPLLSDFWPHGEVAEKYGVLREEGYTERAIFIIDKDGIIRYIDIHDIDDQPSNDVLFAEIKKVQPDKKPVKPAPVENEQEEVLQLEGVMLFCNKWCPGCRRARSWFSQHQIEYTELDVTRNKAAAAQVKEWADGNLTTPTFYINGEVVVDWKLKEVERLLLS